tara:strand:- start:742 stop:942 length:201 start_codon:yes stop_codon:yes gene_type:complete
MSEVVQGALMTFGVFSPVMLAAGTWARSLSKEVVDLKITVATRSARQDATLDDHERRITDLEHHNR